MVLESTFLPFEVKNGELLFWSCDCPYDRGICKHVAALLFAIENEFEDDKNSSNKQKTLQNTGKSEEKSIKYIQTSLNKLSHEALLEFTNKFIELHPLDKVYKMENFIRDSLGEKASFDEETYSYYLSYLNELVDGDLYIELEDDDDSYYTSSYISDDHGITKELKNIILFTEKLFDNSFFKEAQTLIFKLLTIEVSQVYQYGDSISEHISAIIDSFNVEQFFKMYLKCYEETKTDSIKELAEVLCESIDYFEDEEILSSVGGGADKLVLKEGDLFFVTVRNTSKTLSQSIKNIYYKIKGEDLHIIVATGSGAIAINGATS